MLHAMQVKGENIKTNEGAGRPIEISWSTQDTHGATMEKSQLYSFVASARSLKARIEDAQTEEVKGELRLPVGDLGMASLFVYYYYYYYYYIASHFTLIISLL